MTDSALPPMSAEQARASAEESIARYLAARHAAPDCDVVDDGWTAQGVAPPVAAEHARAVVLYAWRRPPVVAVVSPLVPREPEPPQHYRPVSLAAAPYVTWEDAQREEAAAEPWAAIGERLAASPVTSGRAGFACYLGRLAGDVDDYLTGPR